MDISEVVNTATAAALAGVKSCTISAWKARGYLVPVEGSPPGVPLYTPAAVLAAQQTARENAERATAKLARHTAA